MKVFIQIVPARTCRPIVMHGNRGSRRRRKGRSRWNWRYGLRPRPGIKGQHRKHRPEHLLLRHRHVRFDVGEMVGAMYWPKPKSIWLPPCAMVAPLFAAPGTCASPESSARCCGVMIAPTCDDRGRGRCRPSHFSRQAGTYFAQRPLLRDIAMDDQPASRHCNTHRRGVK